MQASQGDRVVLWFVLAGALVYALATLVFGVGHVAQVVLAAGEMPVSLLTSTEVPRDTDGEVVIVSGAFTDASLTVSGLSAFARTMLSIGAVLGLLTTLTVSLAVAWFCWSLLRERSFRRSVTIAALAAGIALLFGGLLGQAATGFGMMQAAFDIDPDHAVYEPAFWFDPAPLFGGFAIMALGVAFQLGERLQRDTDGLV